MAENSFKKEFEAEVERIQADEIMSKDYQKKKLKLYFIRTTLSIILFVVLWKYQWVRWALWVYIPLNLLGLAAILGAPILLRRKIEKTRKKVEEVDELLSNSKEDEL